MAKPNATKKAAPAQLPEAEAAKRAATLGWESDRWESSHRRGRGREGRRSLTAREKAKAALAAAVLITLALGPPILLATSAAQLHCALAAGTVPKERLRELPYASAESMAQKLELDASWAKYLSLSPWEPPAGAGR